MLAMFPIRTLFGRRVALVDIRTPDTLQQSRTIQRSSISYLIRNAIDHFTVVGLVTWPLNDSEAGVDLVLIETSLLLLCKSSCCYAS